jgi:hypothetical protein
MHARRGESTPQEGLEALMTMPLRTEIFDDAFDFNTRTWLSR